MKTLKNIAAAFALIIILFGGCKNPAEDVEIVINSDIFKSPMLIQFLNAKKGSEVPKSFNVQIIGLGSSLVRTTTGGKVFKAAGGMLNLMLDRTANPTPSNPIKFTVIVNALGFVPTFQDVVVTSDADPIFLNVTMLEYKNPSENTGIVETSKVITNGTTSGELVFTTTTNATMAEKSEVTVQTNTTFLDENGQAINGSQLNAQIVHFGIASTGTIPALPGSTFASNVIGANGQPIVGGVYFNPASAISIDMFVSGKKVRSFNKPVTVDMEMNIATINPVTNQPIKENETIPLWSLNHETGQWKSEGNATFVKNIAGKLIARMQINHLSSYLIGNIASECTMNITINRPLGGPREFFSAIGGGFSGIGAYILLDKGEKTKQVSVRVTPRHRGSFSITANSGEYKTNTLLSANYATYCDQNAIFTFENEPDFVNVDVNVRFACNNKSLLTGINSTIKVTGSGETKFYTLKNGLVSGQAKNGVTYTIEAEVDGIIYYGQFTADKRNATLPTGFDLTGTATYTAIDNRIAIRGFVRKDCD